MLTHAVPAVPVQLPLEPAGPVTHYVVWQVQRIDEKTGRWIWADCAPIPCSGEIEAEIIRMSALARDERCVRVIERFGADKVIRLARNLLRFAILELDRFDLADRALDAVRKRGLDIADERVPVELRALGGRAS